jgi:predicted transporter
MQLSATDYVIWWTTPIVMTMIAIAMYRRRLYREFPVFFNYVILQILIFGVDYGLSNNSNLYYYVSWTTTAVCIAVSFAVLLEIFKEVFRPYEALRDLSVLLFRWCALVVLLVAGMWAVTSWRDTGMDNVQNGIYLVGRCVRMVQCALVFFMLLFSEHLGISRRNIVFGISVGLGFYAAVNMLVMTALGHHSVFSDQLLSRINSLAWVTSMLIWLGYVVLPSTVRENAAELLEAYAKLDLALDEARNPLPAKSLLDSMDETVERLLYHRGPQANASISKQH